MFKFRAVLAAILMSAFLMTPTIASAVEEVNPAEQPLVAPITEEVIPVEVQAPAPTPQAAINWNLMEDARRAARDRAMALRQQTINNETQTAQ